MITIQENISLKSYNTFGLDVKAKRFVSVTSIEELKEALSSNNDDIFLLGGGSNILLTKDIDALVIHLNLKGISVISENDNSAIIKVSTGENWHSFVMWCIDNDFGGIENLSLIPGNVGTAPMQNIGAYGVEIKDVFESCEAININTLEKRIFSKNDCNFGYRESVFKHQLKGKFIITNVTFKLTKTNHTLHTSYGAIQSELERMKVTTPTIKDISDAVIAIRQSKLPDPNEIGNSGSFFKNPVIDLEHFEKLKTLFPQIPSYIVSENEIKIPAGWLIEKAGFKGKRFGDYGVHNKQALVLVNYGNADGKAIFDLARLIQKTVLRIFDIKIETEVNII